MEKNSEKKKCILLSQKYSHPHVCGSVYTILHIKINVNEKCLQEIVLTAEYVYNLGKYSYIYIYIYIV